MENTKYGKRREGRWTPIRAKAQDTRANPTSWETHLVWKRWDIGLLWALSLWIMMMIRGRKFLITRYFVYFMHFFKGVCSSTCSKFLTFGLYSLNFDHFNNAANN